MGFVASPETQLLGKKTVYAPEIDVQEDPSFGEVLKAAFRQENIIGAFSTREVGLPETKDDPSFDAYSMFTEEEKNDQAFVSTALYADNEDELEATRKQMNRERQDRDTIAKGGATGMVMSGVAGVMDPISLLSIGGVAANTYRAGKGILSGAAVTGTVVAAETALVEAALHTQQLTRTFDESAINMGAGALLGGVLGGTIQLLPRYGIDETVIREMADIMEVEPKIAEGINPAINAKTGPVGEDSVGAARVVIGDVQVTGKVARFLTDKLGFDPLSRALTSKSPIVRRLAAQLAESPIMLDNFTGQAVESLAKIKSGRLYNSIDNNNKFYEQYTKSGAPKMKRRDFNEAVARAIRTGESDIPEIKASSDFWRKELYDPLKDEMIELKMLPEDVDVSTSVNYLNRVYSSGKIDANYPQFITKVSGWLQRKDLDLYEQAKVASTKVAKAEGKEKADLQEIIDKAEYKSGRDFEAQDYDDIAAQIAQRIKGSPGGRLPYDWKMGEGTAKVGKVSALRGPLRNRTFQIDDEIIEEFLENDIEVLGARYLQQTAADIELTRQFGSVDMVDQIQAVNKEYRERADGITDPKERAQLEKERKADIRDLNGMRDRMRGVYGFQEDNIWTRIGRSSRDLNYLRLLGGVTISSFPDVARIVMAEGFAKTFSKGLAPLISNTKNFKIAASEAKSWGIGTDVLMAGKSDVIADVGDYVSGGTAAERALRSGANNFGKINFLDRWTSGMKQLHAVTMQTSIFDGLSKGKYDKRLGRLGIDKQAANDMMEQVVKHGKNEDGVWITGAKNWDRPDLERMWGVAMRKESDRVIIMPGQEKPLFMSTEMGKTIGQFRSFILSATQRVFIAGVQNQDHNTMGGIISLVGMGAFSYVIKQQLAGREVSDDPAVWITEGIDRSGVLGIVGEINNSIEKISSNSVGIRALLGISAPASRFVSRSVSESILGPSLGSLLSTTVAASNALSSSGPMTESDIRTLRRLIPLQNLSGVNKIFDYIETAVGDM